MATKRQVVKIIAPTIILLASLGAFISLLHSKPTRPANHAKAETAWRVAVIQINPSTQRPTLPLYGRVETPRSSKVRAAVTADVKAVTIKEGDFIGQNELLVELDERELKLNEEQRQADLAEIEGLIASEKARHRSDLTSLEHEKALLALSRRAVERAETLEQRQLAPRAVLDEARQGLERQALELNARLLAVEDHQARLAQLEARQLRARSLLAQAQLDLERTRILSPYTGRIASVGIAPGDRVRPGDELLEIYDTRALEVRAQIPSSYVGKVRQALAQGERLLAIGKVDGTALPFVLDRLAGRVERGSGGVDALLKLQDQEQALPLGHFVELLLQLPQVEDVVVLPFEAIYGLNRVYKLIEGRMRAVDVERVGEYRGKGGQVRVLVSSPQLQKNDWVVTTQLPNAMDGLRIEAVAI